MARRKQTTARPEKIPMKTERIRKNSSSWNTPSKEENKRRGMWSRATGSCGKGDGEFLAAGLIIGGFIG
jgi:hypothetical protein